MENIVFELAAKHNWNMPTKCPLCGGELALSENHTRLKCINYMCKSKITGRVGYWCGTLGIKKFGGSTRETLESIGLSSIADLYKNDSAIIKALRGCEGFGDRKVELLLKELDTHKKTTLANFIAGFNIENIGAKIIQKVIDKKNFTSVNDFLNAKSSDFICEGLKEKTAEKFATGLKLASSDIEETLKYITIEENKKPQASGSKLAGLSFCFTGKACMPRSKLEAIVLDNGGTLSAVKKGLSYLVTDDTESGSAKNKKAKEIGTPVISSQAFLDLLK